MTVSASGGGAAAGGAAILIIIGLGLYMLPTVIGATRKVVNIGSVFVVNLLLGWTLIGWAVALAMALRTNPPHAYPQYWQGAPGAVPPPPVTVTTPAGWYPDGSGVMRWWDGSQWTAHTHPLE